MVLYVCLYLLYIVKESSIWSAVGDLAHHCGRRTEGGGRREGEREERIFRRTDGDDSMEIAQEKGCCHKILAQPGPMNFFDKADLWSRQKIRAEICRSAICISKYGMLERVEIEV